MAVTFKIGLLLCYIYALSVLEVYGTDASHDELASEIELTEELTVEAEAEEDQNKTNNGRYYNHNTNVAVKNCDERKAKLMHALHKLKEQNEKCLAHNPTDKYEQCQSLLDAAHNQERGLESSLKQCKLELDVLTASYAVFTENLGTCLGKNKILAPQLEDLIAKSTQLTNSETKEKKDISECGQVNIHCRDVERQCHEECTGRVSSSNGK